MGNLLNAFVWFAVGSAAGWHAHKEHPERHGVKAVARVAAFWSVVLVIFYGAMYLLDGNGL